MQRPYGAFIPSTIVPCKHRPMKSACRLPHNRAMRDTPVLSARPSSRPSLKLVPSAAYAVYFSRLFLFPPFSHDVRNDLQEAFNLSLNFGYIVPLVFPNSAPVIHPVLEALFHIVIAWAFLLTGFAAHDMLNRTSKPPIQPFLIAALFFTNIVYLPYLALRSPSASDTTSADTNLLQSNPPSEKSQSVFIRLGESPLVPILSVVLLAVSIPWAFFARPEFGPIATRFTSFVNLTTNSDILSYSFVVDSMVFVLFQAALVDNDAHRRSWSSQKTRDQAILIAKFVPFLGLAFYLFQRSQHAPLKDGP